MSEKISEECHEEVTRGNEFQPCDLPVVGQRIDPEWGKPYPVCKRHHREPFYFGDAATTEASK